MEGGKLSFGASGEKFPPSQISSPHGPVSGACTTGRRPQPAPSPFFPSPANLCHFWISLSPFFGEQEEQLADPSQKKKKITSSVVPAITEACAIKPSTTCKTCRHGDNEDGFQGSFQSTLTLRILLTIVAYCTYSFPTCLELYTVRGTLCSARMAPTYIRLSATG